MFPIQDAYGGFNMQKYLNTSQVIPVVSDNLHYYLIASGDV